MKKILIKKEIEKVELDYWKTISMTCLVLFVTLGIATFPLIGRDGVSGFVIGMIIFGISTLISYRMYNIKHKNLINILKNEIHRDKKIR